MNVETYFYDPPRRGVSRTRALRHLPKVSFGIPTGAVDVLCRVLSRSSSRPDVRMMADITYRPQSTAHTSNGLAQPPAPEAHVPRALLIFTLSLFCLNYLFILVPRATEVFTLQNPPIHRVPQTTLPTRYVSPGATHSSAQTQRGSPRSWSGL